MNIKTSKLFLILIKTFKDEPLEKKFLNLAEAKSKLEYFCAYQERCHSEVLSKLYSLGVSTAYHDEIIVHLITENYLNEERFSRSFTRGKHINNHWGKLRIVNELKQRKITDYLVKKALSELPDELYFDTFNKISQNKWSTIKGKSIQHKKQKIIGYLFRKGYESEYIYEKIRELEKTK